MTELKKNMRYTYQIYKISSDYCDKFYIGSTRDFTSRKNRHKSSCNNSNYANHNYKIYQTIRNNHGWESWNMVCIEIMENTTKLEAEIKEEEWRMKLKATLNSQRATRGHMTVQEQKKQHYAENRDNYKQHYQENKDYFKEYNKQYYQKNKEQLRAQANEKFDCQCGGKFVYGSKSTHLKTKKHQLYLDTLGKSI
jgi:hypothetical protein